MNLKRWLLRRLNAVSWDAIPLEIQQQIFNSWANDATGRWYAKALTHSFTGTTTTSCAHQDCTNLACNDCGKTFD